MEPFRTDHAPYEPEVIRDCARMVTWRRESAECRTRLTTEADPKRAQARADFSARQKVERGLPASLRKALAISGRARAAAMDPVPRRNRAAGLTETAYADMRCRSLRATSATYGSPT